MELEGCASAAVAAGMELPDMACQWAALKDVTFVELWSENMVSGIHVRRHQCEVSWTYKESTQ